MDRTAADAAVRVDVFFGKHQPVALRLAERRVETGDREDRADEDRILVGRAGGGSARNDERHSECSRNKLVANKTHIAPIHT